MLATANRLRAKVFGDYGLLGRYREHPDQRQEQFFFGLLKECLEVGHVSEDLVRQEISRNHVRHDAPHCEARREHGSYLFCFNSVQDWDPAWGGATLVLDDGGRLDYDSAPALEEFDNIIECESIGSFSALIKRSDHAWHAVSPIDCPADRLRRVFIVVVNPDNLFWKLRDRAIGKRIQRF